MKEQKKRNHKILGKPILGPIVGSLIGYLICELIFGVGIGLTLDVTVRDVTLEQVMNNTADMLFTPLISVLAGILLIYLYKRWFQGEFKGCYNGNWGDRKTKILVLAVAAVELCVLVTGYILSGIQAPTVTGVLSVLMAGVCEEICFRMIPVSLTMRNGTDKKTICTAIILSSVLFGLIHATNITLQSSTGTLIQVLVTMGMGVFFAAAYLRTGNLLLTIIFHTVYDFLGIMQASARGVIVDAGQTSITGILILAAQAVFFIVIGILMVKDSTREIDSVWKERWNTEQN